MMKKLSSVKCDVNKDFGHIVVFFWWETSSAIPSGHTRTSERRLKSGGRGIVVKRLDYQENDQSSIPLPMMSNKSLTLRLTTKSILFETTV